MPPFTDQTGRSVRIPPHPQRIVSLVPSQTELLHYLGLDDEVVGITKFCAYPSLWHRTKKIIGGTKDLDVALIRSLRPQLIIAGKEENVREQIALLWHDCPTWVSDVCNLPSALQMITEVGHITGKNNAATHLATSIRTAFQTTNFKGAIKAAYLIWRKPYMTVGGDTFIHHMMQAAGFENVFAGLRRYPAITPDDIRTSGCQVVLLSSEPFPFGAKHAAELAAQLPQATPLLVDGTFFSWYGSRLLGAPAYFESLHKKAIAALAAAERL